MGVDVLGVDILGVDISAPILIVVEAKYYIEKPNRFRFVCVCLKLLCNLSKTWKIRVISRGIKNMHLKAGAVTV